MLIDSIGYAVSSGLIEFDNARYSRQCMDIIINRRSAALRDAPAAGGGGEAKRDRDGAKGRETNGDMGRGRKSLPPPSAPFLPSAVGDVVRARRGN